MAKFLDTTGVSYHLEQLIKNTKDQLILISPYLQFHKRVKDNLEHLNIQKIDIRIIYRENKLQVEESNWLEKQIGIRTSLCNSLHAKCYLNKKEAIVTSMNLHSFSQQNNDEMGIYVTKEQDEELYDDISKEAKDLIKKLICKPEKRLTAQEALDHKWFKKQLKDVKGAKNLGDKLKQFKLVNKNSKLQQAALTAISVQASPNDIKHLKDLFKSLDVNGDGSISLEELKTALGQQEGGESLYNMLKAADTDNSGEIDYTEFIAATIDTNIFLRDDYLKTAFQMFDKDGSGKIDNEEVLALLQGEDLQNLVTKEAIGMAMKEIDANGDGEIDFEEFMEMMKKAASSDF